MWICKVACQFLEEMHHQQHSSAKSNCKDITGGTYQTLAKTKAEAFSPRIYDQGLFHCNRSVTLAFSSLVEFQSDHTTADCTITLSQCNCSTIMTSRARAQRWLLLPFPCAAGAGRQQGQLSEQGAQHIGAARNKPIIN